MSEPDILEMYDNLKRDYDSLLKERTGELMDKNMIGTAEEQNTILHEMQSLGYNVVECNPCGVALVVRSDADTYKCFICDSEFDSSDCSDLVFPDKHNDWHFANT